ncbi:MAG TPA: autotransporter-associated beta strand repeat-containing protein, partial [Tepidisphaeraceae bacterium]
MKTKNRSALGRALLGFFLTLMVTCGGAAVAATVTWSGAGTDANLSTATNWAGGIAPQPDDSLIFDGFARLAPVNDFPAATAFDGITFAPTAGPFALGGNSITLHGDLVDNTPVLVQTVNLGLGLDGNRQIVVTDNGLLMIAGAISGTGFGPTKTGNGTLLLTGTNTFTGPLSINAGVVSVASDANLGGTLASPTPGAIVINGGTLRNTASFTLGANRGIALGPTAGSGAGTFDVTTGTTLTYGGVIANNGSGTGGLTKISFGNLSLAGANTYTGPTLVKNGTLTLNFGDAAAPASNIISPSSTLVLGGATAGLGQNNNATLTLTGKAGANNIQTFAGTNIDIYGSVINVTKGTGGNATLNLGALTHTVGGTVVIPTSPSTTAGTVTTTTSVATTNGILGGWAVAGTPNVQRGITLGTDWATVDASGNIVAYNGYVAAPTYDGTDATLLSKNAAVVADADKNLKFTGPSTPSEMRVDNEGAGTTTDINTVAFTTNGADNTLTIGTGNTLRLGVYGGIFKQNIGNNQLYIGGSGGVQSGNGAQGSSGVGNLTAGGPNPNTPGEIVLTLAHNSGSQGNLNIEANIVDNGTGAVTLIKTGVASVKIDGHNTFSGGIFINQGRFQLAGSEVGSANPDGLGTGRVTIAPGGYLFVSGVNSGTLYTGRGAIPGALANTAQNAPITNDMTISGNGTNQEGIGAIRLGGKAVLSGQITLGGDARIGGASASQANFANTNDTYPAINPDGTTLYVDPSHLISGRITGKYNLDIGSAVSIPTNFVLSNTGNDWSGNTTFISGGGTTKLRLGNDEVIPNGIGKGNLIWGPGNNQGILDLAGHNETVNGLSTALATSAANAIIQNDGFVATIVNDPQNPGLKTY